MLLYIHPATFSEFHSSHAIAERTQVPRRAFFQSSIRLAILDGIIGKEEGKVSKTNYGDKENFENEGRNRPVFALLCFDLICFAD